MILFETTESVIEILWDVALAFFASRIALVYFALNFTSGLIIRYLLLHHYLLPDLFNNNLPLTPNPNPYPNLNTISSLSYLYLFIMLAIPPIHSRIIIQRYEIPRVGTFRLTIGAVALVLMVLAGVLVGYIAVVGRRGEEDGWWWWNLRGSLYTGDDDGEERKKNSLVVWMVLLGWLAWYALMPFGMMFLERREEGDGEEEKEMEKEVGEKR